MPKKIAYLCALLVFTIVATAAASQPVISFSAPSYTFPEAEPHSYVHVVCACDASTTVTFQLNLVNNRTYETLVFFGTFANGVTDIPFDLGSFYDGVYDPGRSYVLGLANVVGGTIGTPGTASIAIVEDEAPPQVSINDITVAQDTTSHAQAIFTLSLSAALPRSCFIEVRVVDGSARNGVDFNSTPDAVAYFPARTALAQCAIDIAPERAPEGDETFSAVIDYISDTVITIGKGVGTCTIQGNGAVTPDFQRIPKGGKGLISIQLTDPAVSPEQIVLQSSSSFLTFPATVTLAAGASSADIEIGATDIGDGEIDVTLPPSRGGRTFACRVSAYDALAFSINPPTVQVPLGTTVEVTAKIDPPPAAPITVALTQTNPEFAEIPSSVAIGSSGSATIPIHGIAAGATFLKAQLPDANGALTVNAIVTVTVPAGVAITNLSPRSGRASGGDWVVVYGNDFTPNCDITFDGIPAEATDAGQGAIQARTPPHRAGVVDVGVRCGASTFTFHGAFTYVASPVAITSLDTVQGTVRGGTIVTVSATNLPRAQCTVTFGGVAARPFMWLDTQIVLTTPPHAAGSVPVTLTCDGESATAANTFNYFDGDDPAPVISAVWPQHGAPGESVSLWGSNVRLDDVVAFGGAIAAPSAPRDGHRVVVPELPPGPVAITLRDYAGRTASAGTFTVVAPSAPAITDLAAQLSVGAEFTVYGTGFRPALTFTLGGAILQPVTITPGSALFRVPVDVRAGPTTFAIADRGATADSRAVNVTDSGLAVTAVSPPCALRGTEQLVTITGRSFADGAMVQFGPTFSANVAFRNSSTLVAEVPPPFWDDDVPITVANPDGSTATLTGVFAYKTATDGGCAPPRHHAAGR